MSIQVEQLLVSCITLVVLLAVFIAVRFGLSKLKEYNIMLKGLLGNNDSVNVIIDEAYKLLTEVVTDITMSVSEKYLDDGIITKEEMLLIKQESVEILLKRLSEGQRRVITSIYGDVKKWVADEVDVEIDKLSSGN